MEMLQFWFLDLLPEHWFGSSPDIDAVIKERFGATWSQAAAGELDHWAQTPRSLLALVIVLDQFSRNLHRESAQAYSQDERAQALVRDAIENGWDEKLGMDERQFLYMPLMHAEDLALQKMGVERFEALAQTASSVIEYAERHREIIERFGRFPYRNLVMDRETTKLEADWIKEHGNPFG